MPGKQPDKFKYLIKITLFLVLAFTVLSGAVAHSSEVLLQWETPDDDRVAGYYVFYGPHPYDFESAEPDITINDPDTNSFTLTDLTAGIEYEVAMKSFDSDGNESEFSEKIAFTAPEDDGSDDGSDDSSDDDGSSDTGGDDGQDTDTGLDDSYDIFHTMGFFHNSEFGTQYLNFGFDQEDGLEIESITSSSASGIGSGETTAGFFADGAITIGEDLKGAISPDGNFFAIGGMTETQPSTAFGIRQTQGLYADDFMGEYRVFMVTVTSETQNSAEIKEGVLYADGTNFLEPAGADQDLLDFSAFYYIDDKTGRLSLEPENTYSSMHGALSAKGRIFAAVDAENDDGTLLFIIGIRIPEEGLDTDPPGAYYVDEFRYEDSQTPSGYLLELIIENEINYEAYEIDSTSGTMGEPVSGDMAIDETGRIEAHSENSDETISGTIATQGGVIVLQNDGRLGIGIKQSSDSSDTSGSEDGNAGGSAACFIGALLP